MYSVVVWRYYLVHDCFAIFFLVVSHSWCVGRFCWRLGNGCGIGIVRNGVWCGDLGSEGGGWKTTALLKKSSITEETCRRLCPPGSRPPTMYGLPKVHKEGIPLRPIVSNIGAPTYQLSKHLSGLLNQHTEKTAHHVKNSFHFIRILESLKIKRLEISWSALTWCLYSPKFQWKNHSHFLVNTLMMISWHYTNIC